jgi:hypothetical protein
LPEHTRPSSGQWKACVNRMARGRVFVDVVGKINDEEAMLRRNTKVGSVSGHFSS